MQPYLELTQAVRAGELALFNAVVEKYGATFQVSFRMRAHLLPMVLCVSCVGSVERYGAVQICVLYCTGRPGVPAP